MSGEPTQVETPQRNPFRAEALKGIQDNGPTFFNNFELLFPLSEKVGGELLDYRRAIKTGHKEEQKIAQDMSSGERNKHNSKFLYRTWKDFFVDVDKAVEESGLSLEEIQKMRDAKWSEKDSKKREDLNYRLAVELIPVYVRLREMGYERYDLIF